MAQKLLKRKVHKVAPGKVPAEGSRKVVLVGTYKSGQLEAWPGYYNYPLTKRDKVDVACAKRVNEIWLFQGTKDGRFFAAEFVGEFTRDQLVERFGYPAKGRGHGDSYLLYKISRTEIYNPARGLVDAVIVRSADFATAPKVRKQIKAYLESVERRDSVAANLVPKILTEVPREVLRVCDAAVQMDFWPAFGPCVGPTVPFPPPAHPRFTFIDLFAGIGGFRLAMQRCGGKCVFSSEWDAAAQKTYAANFGEVPYGDITLEETRQAIPDGFDILCGGFPCQPFSSIGKRQGFEHPTQGTLFFHIQKILDEKRPKAFILENVPGLVTHQAGQTLQTIKEVLRGELGYTMDYKVLNAADFGVPQYRKRLYIIGFRNDLPVYVRGEDSQRGADVALDGREAKNCAVFEFPFGRFVNNHQGFGQFVERDAVGPSISKYLQKTYIFKANDGHPEVVDERFATPVKTLCASYHKIQRLTGTFVRGGETGLRLLTEGECKHIMGFPQNYVIPVSRTSMYHQFGNSVAVPVIDELSHALLLTLARAER